MTMRSLTEKYLRRIGKRWVSGRDSDPVGLMPFLILDVMYELYETKVKRLKVCHKMAQWRKRWIESYSLLNRSFFASFDEDERDLVIDAMDGMRQYLDKDLMVAKVALMDYISELSFEDQDAIASTMLCNILSQIAKIVWDTVYGTPERNMEAIVKYSYEFANGLYSGPRKVRFNDSEVVSRAVDILQRKIFEWMREYEESNRNEQ